MNKGISRERIKEIVAEIEGRIPFPLTREEQYEWWIGVIQAFCETDYLDKRKEAEKKLVLERLKQVPEDAKLCNI